MFLEGVKHDHFFYKLENRDQERFGDSPTAIHWSGAEGDLEMRSLLFALHRLPLVLELKMYFKKWE